MILIDVNVLEDVARHRKGWKGSSVLLGTVEAGDVDGSVSAWTVAVVYYFRRRVGASDHEARQKTKTLIQDGGLEILPFNADIIDSALADQRFSGFEDAIQFHTAKLNNVDTMITRNVRHFRVVKDEIAILTPEEFLAREKLASE